MFFCQISKTADASDNHEKEMNHSAASSIASPADWIS